MLLKKGLRSQIRNFVTRPNKEAILIFGNQKSGTSAIAGLLAEYTAKSVTIDTKYLWDPYFAKLLEKSVDLHQYIKRHSFPFSKTIIKEPNLIYFLEELPTIFIAAKFVFIVRDPRSNIRSILNRINLPGDAAKNPDFSKIDNRWRKIVESSSAEKDHYIEVLCSRWNFYVDKYLSHKDKFVLIRYEDFNNNKVGSINHLASLLDMLAVNDISDKVNIQYQPKGDQHIGWAEFFGDDNLKLIESRCKENMQRLEYYPIDGDRGV